MKTDNTMPFHGCIPNQLQALHDECGALRVENFRLRELLEVVRKFIGDRPSRFCNCPRCELFRQLEAVK